MKDTMNMTTTSMEILKGQYNTALQLHDLMDEIRNTLEGMKNSSEITQEIINDFKKKFDKIRQHSPNGFLAGEIFQLTSWLNNISYLTEAIEVCEERMEYLDELLSYFNPSNFKESDGDCNCANHGK